MLLHLNPAHSMLRHILTSRHAGQLLSLAVSSVSSVGALLYNNCLNLHCQSNQYIWNSVTIIRFWMPDLPSARYQEQILFPVCSDCLMCLSCWGCKHPAVQTQCHTWILDQAPALLTLMQTIYLAERKHWNLSDIGSAVYILHVEHAANKCVILGTYHCTSGHASCPIVQIAWCDDACGVVHRAIVRELPLGPAATPAI
jgi:hypothetical protein